MYVFIFLVKVTEWPPIGKIAAHSAYEMFSWYKCLIVGLVFSHLGFWSGNLFLIAPFPDLCLLVPFSFYFIQYTGIFQFTRQAVKMQNPNIFENTNNFGTTLFLTF